jgi:uncharacterized protein (UPF0332 family)
MTLKNLAGIGRLKPHSVTAKELARLLDSAATSLADAKNDAIHAISRFDLAYKSLMQSALAALMANGYRPSTHEPGHQQTTIQTLPKTVGLSADKRRLIDGFSRARNLTDYEGNPVEERLVKECVEAAESLLADVRAWLKKNRPDLI